MLAVQIEPHNFVMDRRLPRKRAYARWLIDEVQLLPFRWP
jgi:hypothetical protein